MLPSLTLDLHTSASILGTDPDLFLEFIRMEELPGILFFANEPKISIFTLAQLLNTEAEVLWNWLEDEVIAELIEEVEEDEWFDGEAGHLAYASILAEAG